MPMQTMIDSSVAQYRVALPVFEGPLDLLLHLIERQELDITQVSLAQVTNQYLDYIGELKEHDPDSLADFLVVAAKLLLIKSRVLLPRPPAPLSADMDGDIGQDLVRQLIEYRRVKQAAQWLREVEAQGLQSYIRLAPTPRLEPTVDIGDLTLDDLLEAMRDVLLVKPPEPSVNGTVAPVTITIADQMELIQKVTARGRSVSFIRLLKQATSRLEVIVTFLAVLEMVKQLRVTIGQDHLFGDILITGR
jgi:segregation and condensation protein A